MNNEFLLIDEKNKTRTAVPVLKISLNSKEYLIYCINRDEKSDNLFVSQIKNVDGKETIITDLEDKEIKNIINPTIKDILEEVLVTGKINSSKIPQDFIISSMIDKIEQSHFTIIDAYLFTSSKENVQKLANAVIKFEEEQQLSQKANIPQLDISKESNLQQALETTIFPETSSTNIFSEIPPKPVSPVIFEPQTIPTQIEPADEKKKETLPFAPTSEKTTPNQKAETSEKIPSSTDEEKIKFINRTFNPDANACDRIEERTSTIIAAHPNEIKGIKEKIQQLDGQRSIPDISQNLAKTKKLTHKQSGLPFPTSTAGYITTAAIVTVGLASVAVASFYITLALIQ